MIFTDEDFAGLQPAIDKLKELWPTWRSWEQKQASVTPKSHNLWFEVIAQLPYLGRFFHFMEDPIEKLHKDDQLTDALYWNVRNYEFREECKRKREATSRNIEVRQQTEQVQQNCTHRFSVATIVRRGSKA